MTLEFVLEYLSRYGKPRVGIYTTGGGWSAQVDMFVTGKGIGFEVKSDFGHATPLDAALQCKERMELALRQIADALPTIRMEPRP